MFERIAMRTIGALIWIAGLTVGCSGQSSPGVCDPSDTSCNTSGSTANQNQGAKSSGSQMDGGSNDNASGTPAASKTGAGASSGAPNDMGTPTPSDLGTLPVSDGGAADTGTVMGDAGAGPPTGGDSECRSLSTNQGQACFDCCNSAHPGGAKAEAMGFAVCACQTPGACKSQCAADFCANPSSNTLLSQACVDCLNNVDTTTCEAQFSTACQGNADCDALDKCTMTCPSSPAGDGGS